MASPATPTLRSSKRLKKALDNGDERPSTEEATDGVCCSICLTEGGRAIRGRIDSCDHHFCFVCIMEWAKVECKCPMCKRSFSTILRPPKDGVFADERIVNVPPRYQVNDLHGIRSFNRYREAQCGFCRGTQDEGYVLICKLCNSAFHTYCVGLGIIIPQEDWFCPECDFMREEHSRIDEGESSIRHASMQVPISLFNITRDRRACNFRGPTTTANIVRDSGASNFGRPE